MFSIRNKLRAWIWEDYDDASRVEEWVLNEGMKLVVQGSKESRRGRMKNLISFDNDDKGKNGDESLVYQTVQQLKHEKKATNSCGK